MPPTRPDPHRVTPNHPTLRPLAATALALLPLALAACGGFDVECEDTDPESDNDNCSCGYPDEPQDRCREVNNEAGDDVDIFQNNSAANARANNSANNAQSNNHDDPSSAYRFVLIEDLSTDVTGPAPGADIDAIGLDLGGDGPLWGRALEDFNIGGADNEHSDPSELLGPPDAKACDDPAAPLVGFTSLGGVAANGYAMVSFGAVIFGTGDSIIVVELGQLTCDDALPDWPSDETAVSISVSADFASFEEIGIVGTNINNVTVP